MQRRERKRKYRAQHQDSPSDRNSEGSGNIESTVCSRTDIRRRPFGKELTPTFLLLQHDPDAHVEYIQQSLRAFEEQLGTSSPFDFSFPRSSVPATLCFINSSGDRADREEKQPDIELRGNGMSQRSFVTAVASIGPCSSRWLVPPLVCIHIVDQLDCLTQGQGPRRQPRAAKHLATFGHYEKRLPFHEKTSQNYGDTLLVHKPAACPHCKSQKIKVRSELS